MVFRTWFSRLGTWISHKGFRVAFGHGLPLVKSSYYMNNKIMALPSTITNANQKDQQFITPIKVYQFE
jgi:hypothetical protein